MFNRSRISLFLNYMQELNSQHVYVGSKTVSSDSRNTLRNLQTLLTRLHNCNGYLFSLLIIFNVVNRRINRRFNRSIDLHSTLRQSC